ncbi:MAG: class II fructose-bisphosphate aldolase [Erysipelotrichaceae bacterium]|nr:class II fructose-bisphosphate aldolase [Erysipelotrichaceae bacterium]
MLVTTKEMFEDSRKKGYAIVAPDYWDSNSCRTYVETAEELGVPVILSFAQAHSDMLSIEEAFMLGKYYAEKATVPVAVHLDHGLDVETVKKAVDIGFTSVMIDASSQPYDVNVARTKEVVDYAHAHGVVVEAELGHVGSGDVITSENKEAIAEDFNIYTDVATAKLFVEETGVDSLAVSIGTSHGLYKGTPVIDFERLHELREALPVPLVLHGGSGSGDRNLEKCATEGISKINVFTDFTVAAIEATKNEDYVNWYKLIKDANKGINEKLKYYFRLFHTGKVGE